MMFSKNRNRTTDRHHLPPDTTCLNVSCSSEAVQAGYCIECYPEAKAMMDKDRRLERGDHRDIDIPTFHEEFLQPCSNKGCLGVIPVVGRANRLRICLVCYHAGSVPHYKDVSDRERYLNAEAYNNARKLAKTKQVTHSQIINSTGTRLEQNINNFIRQEWQ